MRTLIASMLVTAGLFATSGAFAADTIAHAGIDWSYWAEMWREAINSPWP